MQPKGCAPSLGEPKGAIDEHPACPVNQEGMNEWKHGPKDEHEEATAAAAPCPLPAYPPLPWEHSIYNIFQSEKLESQLLRTADSFHSDLSTSWEQGVAKN